MCVSIRLSSQGSYCFEIYGYGCGRVWTTITRAVAVNLDLVSFATRTERSPSTAKVDTQSIGANGAVASPGSRSFTISNHPPPPNLHSLSPLFTNPKRS